MSLPKIFIEGVEMDVDSATKPIAVTYQAFSFLELGSVKANFTNRISLPLTERNKINLEQIDAITTISVKPYRNLNVRIVQDSAEIIPSGTCQILSVQERIELDVQSGIKGFFDAIEGKTLNDINLSAYNGLWDNARHDSTRNTTSGLVCPVTSNGQLVDMTTYVDGHTYGAAMLPFFYYATIMDAIFTFAGYTKSGTIFADANRYLKMVMSTTLVYLQTFIDQWLLRSFSISLNVGVTSIGVEDSLAFLDTGYNAGFYTFTGATFLPFYFNNVNIKNAGVAIDFIRCKVSLSGIVVSTRDYKLRLKKNGVEFANVTVTTGNSTFEFSGNVDLKHNDIITGTFEQLTGLSGSLVISNYLFKIVPQNTIDTDRVQGTSWHWYFDKLLPPIKLSDFMKDFMKMFGLITVEKNKEVTFTTIKEMLEDTVPSTVELSRKNPLKKPIVSYRPSGYAQINNFYWNVQDSETAINDYYGIGKMLLDNLTLPLTLDKYTSIFTASNQVSEKRLNQMAQITIYNQAAPAFTKAASYGYRLLLVRPDDNFNFRFTSGVDRTDYFIGYFIDKTQTYSLDWQELMDSYYLFYKDVLNRYCEIEEEYLITSVEAAQMNTIKPKSKDGNNYIIEKVSNHIPGQYAKFKLIKI